MLSYHPFFSYGHWIDFFVVIVFKRYHNVGLSKSLGAIDLLLLAHTELGRCECFYSLSDHS